MEIINKSVYMLTSELTSQTAGTPRLDRIVKYLLKNNNKIILIDTSSSFSVKDYVFNDISEYQNFRSNIINNIKYKNGSRTGASIEFLRKIKHLLLFDFLVPSLFIAFFKVIFKYKEYKYIMASSPNPKNIILAFLFKLVRKEVFINVDLRDEWALHNHIYFHRKLRKYIEKRILFNSDIITTVSNSIKERLENEYGVKNIRVIYNYNDTSINKKDVDWEKLDNIYNSNKINYFYAGTMPNGYYDEDLFMFFLGELRNNELLSNSMFHFFGFKGEIKKRIITEGYGDFFIFYPPKKHNEILYLMKKSDVLLFFAYNKPDNGGIVSTKLLEYMNSGSKILPFNIKKFSDVDLLIKNICEKIIRLNNKADVQRLLLNDFLNLLPSKKNNSVIEQMKNDNYNNIDEFLKL